MRKYAAPILVIVVSVAFAIVWRCGLTQRVREPAARFFGDMGVQIRQGFARLFPSFAKDAPIIGTLADDFAEAAAKATSTAEVPEPSLSADDPDPASLSPAERQRKYRELVAAANARKMDVLRVALMKSPEGREALKATQAYHAKEKEMKALEEKYGPTDDRVALIRIEMVALRQAVQMANARYKDWKDAHPNEVVDPLADKIYCDLIVRSRFFKD